MNDTYVSISSDILDFIKDLRAGNLVESIDIKQQQAILLDKIQQFKGSFQGEKFEMSPQSILTKIVMKKPYKWIIKNEYDMTEYFQAKARLLREIKDSSKEIGLNLLVQYTEITKPKNRDIGEVTVEAWVFDPPEILQDLIRYVAKQPGEFKMWIEEHKELRDWLIVVDSGDKVRVLYDNLTEEEVKIKSDEIHAKGKFPDSIIVSRNGYNAIMKRISDKEDRKEAEKLAKIKPMPKVTKQARL